jgi:hypothetical protein
MHTWPMAMLTLNISAVDKRTRERDLKYFVENAFVLIENKMLYSLEGNVFLSAWENLQEFFFKKFSKV